jgi:hypothetical protein
MKTAVRNILGDLVEKRLWPVAVALIVGIVAIPLVLARGDAPAAAPTTAPGAAPADAAGAAAVRLGDSVPGERDRGGRVRNPFGTAADASAPTTTTGSAQPASATVPASGSGGSTSGAATPAVDVKPAAPAGSSTSSASPAPVATGTATTPTTPKTTTTKDGTSATYSVSVRFGRTDGRRRTLRDIARLTALPNAKAPVVSLLGVMRDGRTAVLRVAPNTTASGNGACKPSASRCTTVEMKAGDAEYFRVAAGAGADTVAWYYLKLLHVDRHETASKVVAAAAYARRSTAGMAVVRKAAASVRAYRYLPGLGVLVRAKRGPRHAAAAAATDVSRLLPASEQHGVPVWRSIAPRAAKR